MDVDFRGAVAGETRTAIGTAVAAHATLEDVVRWGLSRSPVRRVSAVVTQDEYTHDVVVPWDEPSLYLVYDTT